MEISPQQWLLAFTAAIAAHLLAGALLWVVQNAPPAPHQSPRGVMVSLDAVMAGNQLRPAATPQPVTPVEAASANPVEAETPRQPAATAPAPVPNTPSPAPAPASPSSPRPVAPTSVQPVPAGTPGAVHSAQGVDVPVAKAVTIEAADTLQALEQATAVQATPPPATGVPHTGSGARGMSEDPTLTYIARIRVWLGRHKYYPRAARSSGAQGTVRLYLVVDRSGDVLSMAVAHSSGSPALDQAAMDMVKRAEPLPPMSENMLRTRLEIILPVQFTLGAE